MMTAQFAAQAQVIEYITNADGSIYTYYANGDDITFAGYTGPGGEVTIPSVIAGMPVTSIGGYAFYECTNLASVIIPSPVFSIGDSAFEYCISLTNVIIPDSVTIIGGLAFDQCYALSSIKIPRSVTIIGEYAFSSCWNLTDIIISNGVTSIDEVAFGACGMSSITIPSSVTSIGWAAFASCPNLTSVYFLGNAPAADSSTFDYDTNLTTYYLPGSKGWSRTFWAFPYPTGPPAVLWNPIGASGDAIFSIQNGQFGLSFTGPVNLTVRLEACSNLSNPSWKPLATNTLTSGLFSFSEPLQTNAAGRFYRISFP